MTVEDQDPGWRRWRGGRCAKRASSFGYHAPADQGQGLMPSAAPSYCRGEQRSAPRRCMRHPGVDVRARSGHPSRYGAARSWRGRPIRCAATRRTTFPSTTPWSASSQDLVLVVDCGGVLAGYWGDVLATSAQAARCRRPDHRWRRARCRSAGPKMGFPGLFPRRLGPPHGQAYGGPDRHRRSSSLARRVRPGDLIVADTDGVIALPVEVWFPANAGAVAARGIAKEDEIKAASCCRRTHYPLNLFALPGRG